jgi:hypothetical protein
MCILGINSSFGRHQLCEKMKICSKGFYPVLFNFHLQPSNMWLEEVAVVSGRKEKGRIDGVDLLVSILEDADDQFSEKTIKIPKHAAIKNEGR